MRIFGATALLILLVLMGRLLTSQRPPTDLGSWLSTTGSNRSHFATKPTVQQKLAATRTRLDPLVGPIVSVKSLAEPIQPRTLRFDIGRRASFHPHGEQICASGCAASRHPTETLTVTHFHTLLRKFAQEPLDEAGSAQDELLYFGRQASQLLAIEGNGTLDPVRTSLLNHELTRDHADLEIRVVDSRDDTRASLPSTRVPLDRRHEFELETHDLQPIIASGTVKRVGRDFIWTRL